MKLYKRDDFADLKNRVFGQIYRENILTEDDAARDLGGLLVLIPPGVEGQFHYHVKRESIQIFITGKAVGCFGDGEVPIEAGDVVFIPRGEKHRISNRCDKDVRFLEFFTEPPLESDIVPVG